eukprot:Gb_21667 [translate_table: standard]
MFEEAASISNMNGIISVFEIKTKQVHMPCSWDSLGIGAHNYEIMVQSNVIVGIIDMGVWHESKSFDDGRSPPALRLFKGKYETGDKLSTSYDNKKIFSAHLYSKGFEKENRPLESFGDTFFHSLQELDRHKHGSVTTSVAEPVVENASLLEIMSAFAIGGDLESRRLSMFLIHGDASVCADPPEDINILFDGQILGHLPSLKILQVVAYLWNLKLSKALGILEDLEVALVPLTFAGAYPRLYFLTTPSRSARPVRNIYPIVVVFLGAMDKGMTHHLCPPTMERQAIEWIDKKTHNARLSIPLFEFSMVRPPPQESHLPAACLPSSITTCPTPFTL